MPSQFLTQLCAASSLILSTAPAMASITLGKIGTYATGLGEGSAEISAYDPASGQLYVINSDAATVHVVDLSDPASPTLSSTIDVSAFGAGVTSVATRNGVVAIAVSANVVTDPGSVRLYSTTGAFIDSVTVGALPDMLVFNASGDLLLVANEGEPDAGIDPLGSISLLTLSKARGLDVSVTTLDFQDFNIGQTREGEVPAELIVFPGVALANDLEPEYIALSADGTEAYVALQENNGVAVIDLVTPRIDRLYALGLKDYSLAGNAIDASDRDAGINISNWPVFGMYMPDGLAAATVAGTSYFLTANEGDARAEDQRVEDFTLDPTAFPDAATLQDEINLGRLEITTILGDDDGDLDQDRLISYGARSFSIWDAATGAQVFDSGSDFETITAARIPDRFNSSGDAGSFDSRSDAKGPEPEGIVVAEIDGVAHAFVGLERVGGVMIYDVSTPAASQFVDYVPSTDGDLAPEGMTLIAAADNASGQPLLLVSHEDSGTVTIYQVLPSLIFSDGFEQP